MYFFFLHINFFFGLKKLYMYMHVTCHLTMHGRLTFSLYPYMSVLHYTLLKDGVLNDVMCLLFTDHCDHVGGFEAAGDGSVRVWAAHLDVLVLLPQQNQWENQGKGITEACEFQ